MANAKIINSYSLECLRNGILSEIEEANSRITVCERELANEQAHRQEENTITRISKNKHYWCARCDALRQCLCKIENHIKEVEI